LARTVELPNYGVFNYPDNMSDEEIYADINNSLIPSLDPNNPDPEQVRNAEHLFPNIDRGSFFGGVGNEVDRLKRVDEAVGAAYGRSQEDLDSLKTQMGEAAYKNRYKVTWDQLGEKWNQGDRAGAIYSGLSDFLPEQVGNTALEMGAGLGIAVAAPLAVGAVLGAPLVGAAAIATGMGAMTLAMMPTFLGQNVERQVQERGITDPNEIESVKATVAAGAQSATEALIWPVLGMIPGAKGLVSKLGAKTVSDLVAEGAKKLTTREGLARATAVAGVGFMTEGLEEVGQQMLERAQAGLEVTNPDALHEYIQSFIVGGFIGFGFGAGKGAYDVRRTNKDATKTYEMIEQKDALQAQRMAGQERDLAAYVGAIPPADAPLQIGVRPEFDLSPVNGDTDTSGTAAVQRRINATEGEFNDRNAKRIVNEAMDPDKTGYTEAQRSTLQQVKLANEALQDERYTPEDLTANDETGEMIAPSIAQAITERQAGKGILTPEQNDYTIEELEALASEGEVTGATPEVVASELQKLRRMRRPTTELYNNTTEQDVVELAAQKNIKTGTKAFDALVQYVTGAESLSAASPFRLGRMRETLAAIPDGAFKGEPRDLINMREQSYTHKEFTEAVRRVLNNNKDKAGREGAPRYSQELMKEVFPGKSVSEINDVRDEMERIGLIRKRTKGTGYEVDNQLMRKEFIPANEPIPDAAPIAAMDNKHRFDVEERTVAALDENGKLRRDENGRPIKETGYHVVARPKNINPSDTGAEEVISIHNNRAEAEENARRYTKAPSAIVKRITNPKTGRDKNTRVPTTSADLRGMAADPKMYAAEMNNTIAAGVQDTVIVEAIRSALNNLNERRGLQELGVSVQLVNSVAEALNRPGPVEGSYEGAYVNKIIYLGLDAANNSIIQTTPGHTHPEQVLRYLADVLSHEQIHALVEAGALSKSDLQILARFAATKTRPKVNQRWNTAGAETWTYMDEVSASHAGENLTQEQLEEEAAAEMFRDWAKDPTSVTGKPASLFRRIVKLITTLGGFFRKHGARSVSDIFGEINTGKLRGAGAAADSGARASVAPGFSISSNIFTEAGFESPMLAQHPTINSAMDSYVMDNNNKSALLTAMNSPEYPAYKNAIMRVLLKELPSPIIPVETSRGVAKEINRKDVAFIGNSELIVYSNGRLQPVVLSEKVGDLDRINNPTFKRYAYKVEHSDGTRFYTKLHYVMAESDVDARNKKVGVLANAKRTGGFRVISDPVVDDPTWDNDTNAPLFAIRRWRRSMSDLEYQDATEFAPPAPGKVNAQLGDNVRGTVWLDGKTPLPVVLLRGHDEQGAGFGRKHIVAKQDRFGTGAEMFQKLEDLLANSYVKDAKEYSTTKYVPPRGDANPNDLDYQTRWTDPSDQQVYVLGLEKFDKGGVKYAAITTFYPTRAKEGERTGRGATESDIAAYRRMRDQKFSIAPETEYMAMSSYAKVKELKKLQILNIFGGKRATEQLRSIADEKSRSTMVFMTPDEYRLMTPQNLRLGPDQVKAYANNIDRGMTLNEIPRLGIRGGLDGTIAEVYEHEGRHRSKALQMLGFEYIPVIISHETYRWGERYPSDAVQPTQLRTQTGTTVIQLPESVIFPEGALTPRFKDVVEQDKSDKQIRFFAGLAYDQDDMNASVVRLKEQLSFLARQNFDTSGGLRQRVIRELSQPMVAAAAAHGARVTNSAAQGMYGGVAELSVGFDATFPDTGMAGINNTAAEIMLAAKRSNQTDAFAAVEVPLDYIGENVRPGVTIHFYPKPGGAATSRTLEEVGAFIAQLQTDNIQGYTAFQSNSATSDETGYEGIRFVWVPEYTGVAEADVEKNRIDVVNELDEIVQRAYDLEIGSAKAAHYIAALGQKGTYDATAEALSNPDVGANDIGPIGEHGPWRRSVRSSVAERSGRGKGTPGDGTSTVHDNDGVPRGPQYSIAQDPQQEPGRLSRPTDGNRDDTGRSLPGAKQPTAVTASDLVGDESFEGRATANFFADTALGNTGQPTTGKEYSPVIPLTDTHGFGREYNQRLGNFDLHIATSIPGFREVQAAVGEAITRAYQGTADMLDIGASEGALGKTISSRTGGAIKTVNLDPNLAMADVFRREGNVPGAEYVIEAFGAKESEGQVGWTEDDGTVIKYYKPDRKFDVVHEAMVFQFISNGREAQIMRMKELAKKDGIVIIEEKTFEHIAPEDSAKRRKWGRVESKKDAYKLQYFTQAAMDKKAEEVLVGMHKYMISESTTEAILTDNFNAVSQFWDSGNFKGYVASDNKAKLQKFLANLQSLESDFSEVKTPRVVSAGQGETKFSVVPGQQLLRDNPASLGLNPTMAARVNPIYRTNMLPAAPMPTNQEAALWLERQFGGEVIDDMTAVLTPAQLREVATLMAAEVQLGLQSTGSAFDWYSGALDRTLDVVKVKYPMLADDNAAAAAGFGSAANARFVFTYILAVTSQNLKVSANANATDKAFTEMLPRVMAGQYGMLGSWATGDKRKAMAKNFDKFTDLLNGAPGNTFPDKLTELNRLFKESRTVKDWVKEFERLGIPYSPPGQTAANAVVYGSSMLGPKIGNGFWQNLNGNFNPLTIDLWMRRTWGRLTGKSIGNPGALAGQRDRFKRAVVRSRSQKQGKADHIEAADDAVDLWELRLRQVRALTADAFASQKAFDIEEKYLKAKLADAVEIAADMRGIKVPEPWRPEYNTDQGALLAYAKRALAVWNKEYKILAAHYKLPENSNGQGVPPELQPTWARAAKTIVTNLAKPLDQVANGTQRIQIEAAGAMALDILAERGINMTMADMQAVLWYPEKELWGALTTELDVDEDGDPIVPPSSLNESYDTVFANILGSQGYEVQGTEGNRSGGTGAGAVAGQDDRYVGPESTRGDAPVYAGTDGQAGSVGSEKFSIAPAINTPAFKKWFGNSKVVDAAGKPLVVYHGTASDFEAFDPQFNKVGVQGGGFYFTTRKPLAEDYAYGANRDQEGRLIEAYISLKNPVIKMPGIPLSTEEIAAIRSDFTEGGYDGFIEYLPSGGINTVIATDPTQIKSVNNRGTFDPNDDRISYAVNPSRLDPRGRAYMDMFSENNKSLRDRIARELKRQFSPGGLLPAIVFELKLSRDAKFNVQDDITARTLAAVSRAAKAGYGKRFVNLTQAEKKGIQDALSGVVPLSTLPSQMQAAVVMMRQSLDANSGELIKIIEADIAELLASGDPTAAAKAQMLRDIIESNKGSWVTRSYKVFDDPLWFKKIPQDVLDTAYEYLLRQSNGDHARTQRVFDELTKGEKTAYSGMEALIKESKLGAKDLSILMARKNIAPEIRALMGEYQNPMHNYARSMLKMTRLIWNTHFLKDVLKNGEGVFLFKDGTQPPGFTEMIAGVNSKTLSPLNGMRTTPEIAQAFKDALGKSSMGNVMSTLIGINGIVKAGKILYSPPTQIRNLASAAFFGIASGGVHLKEAIPAANIVWQQIIAKEGSAAKAYRYYVDIGLTHDTPNAGMVQDLMNDGDHMLRAIEYHMQDKFGVNAVEPMISGGKKVHEVISNLYRGGDDVWKIIIFESALTDYMKATGMTRTQAERIVAKRVRDTVPTYSLTGKAIKELGRFPLIGPFVAFSSEIIRTTINSVKLIKSDMADPRLRGLAMKRIVGMTIAHSWAFAAMAASKIANGLDDDDEEAIRKIGTGPWGTNSDYLFTGRNDKGQLTYVDLSFLDPYNMFHKAVTSMLRNQPWEAKLAGAAAEIYMPFVQPDIAFSGIYEVVTNSRMRSGAPIYNPDAPVGDQTMDIASHLFFQLAPGVVNPIRKVAKAMKGDLDPSGRVYDLTNEAAGMFGLRINTFDPKSSLYWRVGDFNEAMSNSRKYLGDIARDLNPRSEEELADAFKTANSMRLRAYDDMMQMVNAAKNSGLSDQAVRKVLRLSNVSKTYANALALGRPAPDWRIEKSFLRGASKRAAFLIDQEKANELRERRNFIRDTARAARSTE
jgi:hypothetical protein